MSSKSITYLSIFASSILVTGVFQAHAEEDPSQSFGAPVIQEIPDQGWGEMGNLDHLSLQFAETPIDPVSRTPSVIDDLTDIINIGKSIWKIIVDNEPESNVKVGHANALPLGVEHWTELEFWDFPKSKVYEVVYKNGFGMEVIRFHFRILYTHSGKYKSRGNYLSRVTALPAHLEVAWGYTFNAETSVPNVYNLGSQQDPIAGMDVDIMWKVESKMKDDQRMLNFVVTGLGELHQLD